MSAYLFVHFREKDTPDGEQVYFGLSRDGFHWEAVNGGQPVLWAYYGCKGVRDFTICRSKLDGTYYIVATDLSLAYGMRNEYRGSWDEISRNGSKCLSVWESEDLITWSEQRLVHMGRISSTIPKTMTMCCTGPPPISATDISRRPYTSAARRTLPPSLRRSCSTKKRTAA